jgi:argininosuccinate lyase
MIGRLTRPPHPVLFALLYEPPMARAHKDVLPYLLPIDAAHVVMLAERGLLAGAAAAAILGVNQELGDRLERGDDVLDVPAVHRGVYFVYEREYITRLGDTIGGAAHLARSRNDINAAIARMRLRERLAALLDRLAGLVDAMASRAEAHRQTTMSGFTHMQPAQPTTLGHYFAGVTFELLRSIELLDRAYDTANRSPMGAAAGFGTSFPIDRRRVAELLGFAGVIDNSIDAVSSRDFAAHVLHALAMLGITLTRLATDLQTWSSVAYGFIGWSDDFVSTSSIMPHKRNAFVLEDIRGHAAQPLGALVATMTGMKNVPFANSVEVSAEATSHLWPALDATATACELTALLVANLEVHPQRAREFAAASDTCMTAVTDALVAEHGLAFRTAHEIVGRAIREGAGVAPEPLHVRIERGLAEATGATRAVAGRVLVQALDPDACVRAAEHGGGPGPDSVRAQLDAIAARLDALRDRSRERRRDLLSSTERRRAAAAGIGRAAARRADRDVPNSV